MAGCSYARLGSQVNTVSAAWGGLEGIGTEISEIQKQIDALDDPNDPLKVANLLQLKRDTMMLEFETAIRYPVRDQFVVSKNIRGYTVSTFCFRKVASAWAQPNGSDPGNPTV